MKIVEISARKNMLKIDNAGTTSWYKINESNTEGLELAQTLTVGDEVEVKFTVINGVSVVNQLEKSGSSPAPTEEKTMEAEKVEVKQEIGSENNFEKKGEEIIKETSKFTCTECGKALKDDKYEKCYTCNQKEWKSKSGSSDRNSSIERQAIGKMTATTIAQIANQNSTEGLLDLIDQVYDKYKEKVLGE